MSMFLSRFAWWFPFANKNQRWMETSWKSRISFLLLQNHDIKRLVYIVNITSNYPSTYPHIFAIPPFTTHPGNDFADEKTHGGRARVSANVWAEGCGPSARHAGPGELWGWGSLRKKHLWIIVVSCFHNTRCSSIARRKKHTVYGFMHLDMGTSWLLRVFKCWR